jgi:Fe-S-cluster containining protein
MEDWLNKLMEPEDGWECIKCGMCCRQYNPETDSVEECQHLQKDNTCGIYEDRPIACKLQFLSDDLKYRHCSMAIISIQQRLSVMEMIEIATKFEIGKALNE